MVIAALGLVGTILVLIRLIDIPEAFQPTVGRGIGIWLSLLAATAPDRGRASESRPKTPDEDERSSPDPAPSTRAGEDVERVVDAHVDA